MDHPANDAEAARVWVLCDTVTGHRRQAVAIAEAVGWRYVSKRLHYNMLSKLPNAMLGASFRGLRDMERIGLQPPWPELVIAAGRKTAPVARAIRAASGGATRLVQIMDPGAGHDEFSLIAIPSHDDLPDALRNNDRVISTLGAPYRITPEILQNARTAWQTELEPLGPTRIAAFVGGGTRRRAFTEAMARELAGYLITLKETTQASLMITSSPRTGKAGEVLMRELGGAVDHAYDFAAGGHNPYDGYIAWADRIVVTGDSVSMCSEVCAAAVPVEVYAPEGLITPKHARFHQALYEARLAVPMGQPLPSALGPALDVSGDIANRVRSLFEASS